jgi:Asp-tRNA(Asn)/Glu-tRNA(Gln) amidotransferase A subunit family amidase
VIEAHLERIEAVNPAVGAVRVTGRAGQAEADKADRRLAARSSIGPLHEVPVSVGENVVLAGQPLDALRVKVFRTLVR